MHIVEADVVHESGEESFSYRIEGKSEVDSIRKAITKFTNDKRFKEVKEIYRVVFEIQEQPSDEEIARIKAEKEAERNKPTQFALFGM